MREKEYVLSFSVISGLISTYFERYGVIFIFVAVAICFDVVTGLVASAATGVPITSERARKGFWKKVCFLLAVFLGIFMDAFIPELVLMIGIKLPFNLPFGCIVSIYVILTELISIAENIYKVNKQSMPKWIIKLLQGYKKNIDDLGKEDNNK